MNRLWKQFRAFFSNRWLVFVATMWIQSCAGIGYVFGSISPVIKSSLHDNQRQITRLGVAKDLGDSVGFLAGSLCEVLLIWRALLVGALQNFVGYGWVWLIVTHRAPTLPLWAIALLSSLIQIAGVETGLISEAFKPEFYKLVPGTLSLPINLLGTNYHRGFQARKNIISILKEIVWERRASATTQQDMLGCMGLQFNWYYFTVVKAQSNEVAISGSSHYVATPATQSEAPASEEKNSKGANEPSAALASEASL